jgi:class 3 adenylate cyclase
MSVTTRNLHRSGHTVGNPQRVLTTVLFTDIVDSTRHLHELGDRAWGRLLSAHHALCRDLFERFDGLEIDDAGDGFLAAFSLATRALACARSLHAGAIELDLELRSGLHTGECELVDGRLRGIAVHVGARAASLARPGEVLVTSTVLDVVQGVSLSFEDRGVHRLRGLPGSRQLFAALPRTRPRHSIGASARRAAVGVSRRRQTG